MSYKNLVYSPAHHESFVAQWLEHPTGVWKVTGSIPVGDSDFSLPRARDMLITSFLHRGKHLPSFFNYHINGRTLVGTLNRGGRLVEV